MAAVTQVSYATTFTSNKRVILAKVTAAATGDTWVSGLKRIEHIHLTPTADAGDVFASESSGTVTIGYDGGGAKTFYLTVIGD